jgi:sugar-specific transcriptional regulator TrmB
MSINHATEKLRQLGLTEYEVQAYLALVEGDQMTAEEIARNAKIPVPRVYGVLESLNNLGLIVILKGRPKKFEIISPSEGLQKLLDVRRKAAADSLKQLELVSNDVREVLSPIFWREKLRIRPEELLESLENLALAEKRTKQLIKEAKKSIDIFTDLFSWFDMVKSDLIKARKADVRVRVLMNVEHATSVTKTLQKLGIEIRQTPDLKFPVRGTLVDSSKVVFLIWASPKGGKEKPRYVYRPSYSANEGIAAIFQQSFDFRWQHAKARKPRN